MAYDIALNTKTHDIAVNSGNVRLIDNKERIAQQLRITLWEWLGEWFLDARDGVPYREYILVKNPNMKHIRQVLSENIMKVDGVNRIDELNLKYNPKSRTLIVDFAVDTDDGQIARTDVFAPGPNFLKTTLS